MPASTPSRARHRARRLERVLVVDGHDLVDEALVEHRRDEARADALDLVRPGPAARDHGGRRGLHGDEAAARVALLEEATGAGERAAGADAGHQAVDLLVHRRPDLRARRAVVRLRVGGVGELVGKPDLAVARQRARRRDGLVHPAQRLGHLHLGAVQAQQALALAAHALRQREDQVVALGRADERQRDAGVAAGGLDDRRPSRLDPALGLGRLDHGHADPVLDRAAGVEHLELGEQLAALVADEARELHHRGAADVIRNVDRNGPHCPHSLDGRPVLRCSTSLRRPRAPRARPHPRPSCPRARRGPPRRHPRRRRPRRRPAGRRAARQAPGR